MTEFNADKLKKELKYFLTKFFLLIFKIAFIGYAVSYLWNMLIPDLFNIKEITFWQAVVLRFLISFLVRKWPTGKEMREAKEEEAREIAKL